MRGRDETEFTEFVRSRASVLLRFCVLLTGDRQDGEDLFQTSLIRLCRRWTHAQEDPEGYLRKILVNLAHDALRKLPSRQRKTVVLRFWCDFSVDQVAETLGCSTGTVKSQTSKAIAAVRKELEWMTTPMGADHHE